MVIRGSTHTVGKCDTYSSGVSTRAFGGCSASTFCPTANSMQQHRVATTPAASSHERRIVPLITLYGRGR